MNMEKLTWRNFYELSLLSYFDVYEGNETVEDLLLSILLDRQLIEDYKTDMMFQMNMESLRHINPHEYRNVRIEEVFDDNFHSGVYLYRFCFQDIEILAIRGSEELDERHHKTGWQDWRDNFEMYTPGPTLQQLITLHYMHGLDPQKKRFLCGHSKGGHLAVFSTMAANKALFDSIEHVYSFNAPGITDSLLEAYEQRIQCAAFQDKITLIENEHDCISSFFHHVKAPYIIKSNTPGNTLKQLYENHQLHTMMIEGEDFIQTDKKSVMPRLVHHFINDFFVKLSPERLAKMVERMDEYFNSGLSKSELYRVLIYQVSKYTSLFDELSYDEVATITFQDLIERRRTKLIFEKLKEIAPSGNVSTILHSLREDSPLARLNEIDMKSITDSFVENYEATLSSTAASLKVLVSENNRRIMIAVGNIQNRMNKGKSTTPDKLEDV